MTIESDTVAAIAKSYSKEIAILRTRYRRILTVYYSSGLYRLKDANGEVLFSHENPVELEKFLYRAAN